MSDQETTGWQPIETAPKDGTWVMLGRAGRMPEVGSWENGSPWLDGWFCGGERSDSYGPDFDPTHWMPLPEPPHAT